jgi:hypothetical protein
MTAKDRNAEVSPRSKFDLDGGWSKFGTMPGGGGAAGSVANKAGGMLLIRSALMPLPNLDILL